MRCSTTVAIYLAKIRNLKCSNAADQITALINKSHNYVLNMGTDTWKFLVGATFACVILIIAHKHFLIEGNYLIIAFYSMR